MERWKRQAGNVCQTLGVFLIATLIVSAFLGAVFYLAPIPAAPAPPAVRFERETTARIGERAGPAPKAASRRSPPTVNTALVEEPLKGPSEPGPAPAVAAADAASGPQIHDQAGDGGREGAEALAGATSPDLPATSDAPSTSSTSRTERRAGSGAQLAPDRKTAKLWEKSLRALHARGFHPRRGSKLERRQARDRAEAELNAIDDPAAVPALWRVFAGSRDHDLLLAQTLARISSTESTRRLAYIAVESPDEKARHRALEALRSRDASEFVGPLVNVYFNRPLKHRRDWIKIPGQGAAQVLLVTGERADYRFVYPPSGRPGIARNARDVYTLDNPFLTRKQRQMADNYNRQQAELARSAVDAQVKSDIEQIQRLNQRMAEMNHRANEILRETTGETFGPRDREGWLRWLAHREGKAYEPPATIAKRTFAKIVPNAYLPSFIPVPAPT